ncbi:SDR family oxidoreductase [Thalassolituus marinus]|uniref:SDR family oxidoreductase n=1 Tax=Thalassolituus marinus TaxID=671053 RepID=A0ABS7ZW49_9GAMM|nr:SDR family oxidoreductase [Thalassolituus marinus]MCA6064636.1 SDR family oxidoreductase [Thalassolituus marinus]
MIAITGATGQLGRLVIQQLLQTLPAEQLIAAVRSPERAADLQALGVQVREADYSNPQTLQTAFAGVNKLLLISSSEVGQRAAQHANVIAAARDAGVALLVYTSILHADSSPLPLAEEHKATEQALAASGLPYTLLRNGWYTENYAASVPAALQFGVVLGAAGEGRIASAARADYAAAAAQVMLSDNQAGKVYELAGDDSYTLSEFAGAIAQISAKNVSYNDMSEADFTVALTQAGLPAPLATMFAESDTGASKGGLFDDSHSLSGLIGRPTTPYQEVIAAQLNTLS